MPGPPPLPSNWISLTNPQPLTPPPGQPAPLPPAIQEAVAGAILKKPHNPGKFARGKGARGEREVIKELQAIINLVSAKVGVLPVQIQRNSMQSDKGGQDLHGLQGHYSFEVKFCEKDNVPQWFAQCLRQTRKGEVSVLLYRAVRTPWKVKMRAYLSSPKGDSSTECDVDITFDDFKRWFQDSFEEIALTL